MPTTNENKPIKTTLLLPPAPAIQQYIDKGASAELANCMYWFERHMRDKQMAVLVYCVFRSLKSQAKLYAQGRTEPGHIVTNARPGQSAHNRTEHEIPASDAFDACPVIDGKPCWLTTGPALLVWQEMGHAAESLGLQWGRQYKQLGGDWAHFQYQRKSHAQEGINT